jgi:putative N6-adenine-specific DNA methylase
MYAANLWLRTPGRIVVRLARFHASTFHELERRAKRVPWMAFLPVSGTVRVRATCRKSRLYHSDAVAERVLAAIALAAPGALRTEAQSGAGDDADQEDIDAREADAAVSGTVDGAATPGQLFFVRIVDDECEISADTSGELLHRRGYRQETGKAPLRETLAAAMVLASGWKPTEPLIDPLCGSGTIAIEAALLARGIAPGLRRRFAFMEWPTFEKERWDKILGQAQDAAAGKRLELDILGADRDSGAIEAAARNAERAGVAGDTRFEVRPLSASLQELEGLQKPGWILANPPYGVRLGEPDTLGNLYAKLGSRLKSAEGWRLGILTSDVALARQTGLPLRARFSTRNGGISVAFLAQEKRVAGTLASINISGGGVPKRRVTDAKVSRLGLQGDEQDDKVHHGGPERAVCIYSLERIRALQAEGHPIQVGSVGENLTVEGVRWESVMPGSRLRIGDEVQLEITSFTSPCKTIRRSFIDGRFVRISQKVHPGWSRVCARVIAEGEVRLGDRVEIPAPG